MVYGLSTSLLQMGGTVALPTRAVQVFDAEVQHK